VFQQECLKRGVLFGGGHNISYSHSAADVAFTLETYRRALEQLDRALASGEPQRFLEGEAVEPVFREP
jgi:hypothetical protein